MHIFVNGKSTECEIGMNVIDLLCKLGMNPEKIVVELNENILASDAFASTALHEDDRLELLQFVGGG